MADNSGALKHTVKSEVNAIIVQLQFALGITGPILILMMLGFALHRGRVIDSHFVEQANSLVFNVALPALLFFAIANQPLQQTLDQRQILTGLLGTLILVGLLLLTSQHIPKSQRGVFIQGAYRGNIGVIGVAYCVATYGQDILPLAAIYLAIVTALYNVIAVWLLNSGGAAITLARNPLIIAIIAGAVFSWWQLPLPGVLISTGKYLAAMALPVALICIGASLRLSNLQENSTLVLRATWWKLLLSPVLLVSLGLLTGLQKESLGIVFLMASAPTASASYTMARQLTSCGQLASEIIAVTMLFSVFSITTGLVILRTLGLI